MSTFPEFAQIALEIQGDTLIYRELHRFHQITGSKAALCGCPDCLNQARRVVLKLRDPVIGPDRAYHTLITIPRALASVYEEESEGGKRQIEESLIRQASMLLEVGPDTTASQRSRLPEPRPFP
jgi:hypothetical protein